jgi:hypothetical protein
MDTTERKHECNDETIDMAAEIKEERQFYDDEEYNEALWARKEIMMERYGAECDFYA